MVETRSQVEVASYRQISCTFNIHYKLWKIKEIRSKCSIFRLLYFELILQLNCNLEKLPLGNDEYIL